MTFNFFTIHIKLNLQVYRYCTLILTEVKTKNVTKCQTDHYKQESALKVMPSIYFH